MRLAQRVPPNLLVVLRHRPRVHPQVPRAIELCHAGAAPVAAGLDAQALGVQLSHQVGPRFVGALAALRVGEEVVVVQGLLWRGLDALRRQPANELRSEHLVHAHLAGGGGGPGEPNPALLEQPLDRPVLAHPAVHREENDSVLLLGLLHEGGHVELLRIFPARVQLLQPHQLGVLEPVVQDVLETPVGREVGRHSHLVLVQRPQRPVLAAVPALLGPVLAKLVDLLHSVEEHTGVRHPPHLPLLQGKARPPALGVLEHKLGLQVRRELLLRAAKLEELGAVRHHLLVLGGVGVPGDHRGSKEEGDDVEVGVLGELEPGVEA
mmetsp:Transcript_5488/g.19132  ORF Transcript_5488/g.19132 Transcript_5488/m.19132 type:complete len:322 (+) Transcript_5488:626-1591(+)